MSIFVRDKDGNRKKIAGIGTPGPTGPIGPEGKVGKSAYQYAVDGGFTGTEEEFAATVGVRSNPNLLDNWYFVDPINQRGIVDFTGGGNYIIDRWRFAYGTATLVDGVGLRLNGDSNNNVIYQMIEKKDLNIGQTYTISCLTLDGKMVVASGVAVWSDTWTSVFAAQNDVILIRMVAGQGPCWSIDISSINASIVTIKAAKLEQGPVQTLAHQDVDGNWVLNDPPPNKTTELLKCQRYYKPWVISFDNVAYGIPSPGKVVYCVLHMDTPMRITPAVINANDIWFDAVNGIGGWMHIESILQFEKHGPLLLMSVIIPDSFSGDLSSVRLHSGITPGVFSPIWMSADL